MSNHDRKGPDSPERDALLEQAWHQASHEQPPSRLDAAIIAAAHEAVRDRDARPQVMRAKPRSWLTRWQPVAAAAAVTGLAFLLVQTLPRDPDVAPSIQVTTPAIEAEQQVLRDPPVLNEKESASSAVNPLAGAGMERDKRAVPAPTATPPAAFARQSGNSVTSHEAVAERATDTAAAEVDQRDAATPSASTGIASGGIAAPASTAKQSAAASMSAADWVARVAALYDSGDTAHAGEALRAFRAAYPDADGYLPESLHLWAKTVE